MESAPQSQIVAAVNKKMREQYGVITRAQARSSGMTRSQIHHRLKTGELTRITRGVFRHAAAPPRWEADVVAAVLASRGIASHRCAAALWRLDPYQRARPEVTIPVSRSAPELAGVVVHRTTQWDRRSETVRRGIRCTGVERTILDCGAVLSVGTIERLAESAIRQGLTSWASLERCRRAHARRGRDGGGTLRQLLEQREPQGALPLSDFSRAIANLLTEQGLPAPVLEHQIVDSTGVFIMQADLAWPQLKKAIELDGLTWHFGRDDVERDRRKRAAARAQGWRIQEVLWSMYAKERPKLTAQLHQFLAS